MAILTLDSVQRGDGYRSYPIEDHGKLRFQYANLAAVAVAGDDGSMVDLFDLPPGRVRILPWLCRVTCSALGSSRTLDIGHRAYVDRSSDQLSEAENLEAFLANLDVSSAVAAVAYSTVLKYDIYSVAGVRVSARVQGGTWPVGATMSTELAYLYE